MLSHYNDVLRSKPELKSKDKIVGYPKANDQRFLNPVIFSKRLGLRVQTSDAQKYASGRWYDEEMRGEAGSVAIQFNWLQGIMKKIQRAQAHSHWYLNEDGTCLAARILHPSERIKTESGFEDRGSTTDGGRGSNP